jgi:GTP cyclohydrolase IA
MEHIVSWKEILSRLESFDRSKKYYGVPRGGQYIAAALNPVDKVWQADIIIDDLIDSGATREKYAYTNKPFVGLFDKQTEPELAGKWLVFPWESKEEPAEHNVSRILQAIGENPERQGLKDTPKRYMKFLKEFTEPKEFKFTTFDSEGMSEMIIQKDIPFYSLCEHHMAPFFGTATVAYIPSKRIVGLSKLARVVDMFANRLQNQERITQQIADKIQDELAPIGVAVSLTAEHMCMSMRGVKKTGAKTTTQCLKGAFLNNPVCRAEFIAALS